MLQGLRNAGRSWLGKIIVTGLFGLLILSFAVWGIGDIFRGRVPNTVATVGETEITVDALRNAYNAEIQNLQRRTRQAIPPDVARALGFDRQVLQRLVTQATLDERARALGLAVSDELVRRSILEDPAFKGADGQFSRLAFDQILQSNNFTEDRFVREQRFALARQQLVDAVTGDLSVPLAVREALHRYGAERRTAAYFVLSEAAAGEVPAPTDEQVRAFYEERKSAYRAPEYRALSVLPLSPEALAKPDAIPEAEVRQHYESIKSRFGTPERRTIQQILFSSTDEAAAALQRIRAGATFEEIATERGIAPDALTLGTFTQADLVDRVVADAAFALPAGGVSEPVQGRFGQSLVRVTEVQPGSVRPFEEVRGEVARELALERARAQLERVHDTVEDMRASARPLADIARETGLALIQIPAVSQEGLDKAGQPVAELPEGEALIRAAFASDIGVDNEALRPRAGGYVWYDVTGIEPARDRPLEEVRDQVAAAWRAEEISRRLAERARGFVERLKGGEAIETVAAEAGVPVATATDLARTTAQEPITTAAAARIFSVPVGQAESAPVDAGRLVFRVTGATMPPFVTTTPQAEQIQTRMRQEVSDDLLAQYVARLQSEIGVSINQGAVARAIGGEP